MESAYRYFQNGIIYRVVQESIKEHRGEIYLRKALPNYMDEGNVEIFNFPTSKLGAMESDGFKKKFFVETVFRGKTFRSESYLSEKVAMLEVILKIAEEYKIT